MPAFLRLACEMREARCTTRQPANGLNYVLSTDISPYRFLIWANGAVFYYRKSKVAIWSENFARSLETSHVAIRNSLRNRGVDGIRNFEGLKLREVHIIVSTSTTGSFQKICICTCVHQVLPVGTYVLWTYRPYLLRSTCCLDRPVLARVIFPRPVTKYGCIA